MSNLPTLIFYEKPGCSSNAQQKKLLRAVGFSLDTRNLLTAPWNAASLKLLFGELPVVECFNKSAPNVKQGFIKPGELTQEQAIALMLKEPLLIRRPLIECGNKRWVGFDMTALCAEFKVEATQLPIELTAASEACTGSITRCTPADKTSPDSAECAL